MNQGILQCERAVIGCLLIEPQKIVAVRGLLEGHMLYHAQHKKIFQTIEDMGKQRRGVDMSTVLAVLGDSYRETLLECVHAVSTADLAKDYAREAAKDYYSREIRSLSASIVSNPEADDLIEKIQRISIQRASLNALEGLRYDTDLHWVIDKLPRAEEGQVLKVGLPTVDGLWGGTRGGDVNVWAAATNTGKSILLLNLLHLAAGQGQRCLYFGTEMSSAETVHRHLSIVTGIDPYKINAGRLTREDYAKIIEASGDKLCKLPIMMIDRPEPSLEEIEQAIGEFKPQLIFLDYLERFSLPREENLRLRIKEFMRRLKNLARERGVVVHLAVQLNRDAYGGEEKRPTLANIAESSAVEKEADRVMLIWSPSAKQNDLRGRVLEIIQAKNRKGKRGIIFDLLLNEQNLTVQEIQ